MARKRRPTIAARQPKSTQGVRIQLVSNLCEGSKGRCRISGHASSLPSSHFLIRIHSPTILLPRLLPTSNPNLVCLSSSDRPPLTFSLDSARLAPKNQICDRSDLYMTSSRMKALSQDSPQSSCRRVVLKSRAWPCDPC